MTQPTQAIESAIQASGANIAPRITLADIEENIVSEHYFSAADGDHKAMESAAFVSGALCGEQARPIPAALHLLTFCVLVLRNGFTVTGESACASPENFNAEIGRRIARENAVAKIWPLMGYELRTRIANGRTTIADRSGLMVTTESLPSKLNGDQPIPEDGDKMVQALRATAYQDRVRAEYDELNAKLSKLVAFFSTDTFEALPKEEKDCLTAQHAAMCDYSNCLSERIQAFGQ